ncbi:MAG: 3-deoxy-D-manno-octulosonic acid transferase [Burkholderiales bacterium]
MWRIGYNLVLWIALPVVMVKLWWRGLREPLYRHAWRERFGIYDAAPPKTGRTLWLHAVSLGEVNAASPLIERLLDHYPQDRIILTQMTATGREAAIRLFGGRVTIVWLPYDYSFAVRRFLNTFNPAIGIFIETEIWFNLIEACAKNNVALFLANARLSEKSYLGYKKITPLARRAFGAFDAIAAQTTADAARLSQLGARDPLVVGNLKFDVVENSQAERLSADFRARYGARPVLIASNTRDGEEDLLLDALANCELGNALTVIVPRHPDRFDAVAQTMARRGLRFERRSTVAPIGAECNYFLGDSVGEMGAYYRAADVAFIGGSLLDYGGHNLIEACAAGVPVLIGPYTRNFEEAARLAIEAGAALRVKNAEEVVTQAKILFGDSKMRARMGKAARDFAALHRGAAEKMLNIVVNLLETSPHQAGD